MDDWLQGADQNIVECATNTTVREDHDVRQIILAEPTWRYEDLDRGRTIAAIGSADAQPGKAKRTDLPKVRPGANTSFASLKQNEAGVLNVGYAEAGPANGPVVILLHGWPYDIYSYVDVGPLLASVGYRVIVPYLRG